MLQIEDLIEEIDIVDYISQFVELEEKGGEYWALSPFKEEKTPSFSVRRETGEFYDFSSGVGGNVFTFVKKFNNCSAQKAIEILENYLGREGTSCRTSKILAATVICKKFKPQKSIGKKSSVKIYPNDFMERFATKEDKFDIWRAEGISDESLTRFEVRYDSFSNRLVYPIRDINGTIVNIGGRTLAPDWKDRGLRKYTYFSGWGEMNVIYGMYENMEAILKKKEVILFEGCKSVLKADTWGIKNSGAILTSHLNPCQMKILARLGVRVVFALDKDVRIKDDRNISKLKRYVNVEYLWDHADLLDDKDSPVDKGKAVFQKLYEQRLRF